MNGIARSWVLAVVSVCVLGCTGFHGRAPDGGADSAGDKPATNSPDTPGAGGDAADLAGNCAVATDPKNCGACGHDCSTLPNVRAGAAVECRQGRCWLPPDGCSDGYGHCSTIADDGCETSLTRPETCGGCATSCKTDAPLCASSGKTQTCVATCPTSIPDKCGVKCVDVQNDVANCGACGNVCSFPNADAACVNGVCTMKACRDGYGNCTDAVGCETPLTTAANCGACGQSCGVDHGVAQCVAGKCGPVVCDPNYGNCDTASPDCETPLNTTAHCGACTTACGGATSFCATVADKQTCVSDCQPTAPTKCGSKCVNTDTDVDNCGRCGNACSFPNAAASCVNGQCVMGACKGGFGDCNSQPGCETPLGTSANCARCNDSCSFANATSTCDGTRCSAPVCYNGFGNCDGDPGCETILNTPEHCGGCTTVCGVAAALCSSSTGKPTCVSDCSNSTPTKCGGNCVDTSTDVNNCGGCGMVCSFPNAQASCASGKCVMGNCKSGYGDCDAAQPGCETPLGTSSNCSKCGDRCSFAHAASGCDGTKCTPPICDSGYGNCDSASPDCETLVNTPARCGSCTTACANPTPLCSSASGKPTCASDCSASMPTKCGSTCVDTNTDVNNCGVCGMACSFPNAAASCVGGKCVMGACKSGFGDCNAQSGCETQLGTSSNCSRCNDACSFTNATSTCDGTKCTTPVCINNNYANCDTSSPDCETLVNTAARCGGCSTVCSNPTPVCSVATGNPTCVSDCTASAPTKCGTACVNTTNDTQHCGSCSKVCTAPGGGVPACRNSQCDFDCTSGRKCGNACIANDQQCNGACASGFKPCGAICVSTSTCCTAGQTGCGSCQTCQQGTCQTTCNGSQICSNNQCCDSQVGQSCTAPSECQTATYDCNGDCVPKNKSDGVACGPSGCPAKICQNGICNFGGINSCPAGQVCSNGGGCILSGLRSKATIPGGEPYQAQCFSCGDRSGVCCPGRTCNSNLVCIRSAGEYCADCSVGDSCTAPMSNVYCEMNYY